MRNIIIQKTVIGAKKPISKTLDVEFTSMEDAENYVKNNILTKENSNYVTFKLRNLNDIDIMREYMFLDENDFHIYSYRIVKFKDES